MAHLDRTEWENTRPATAAEIADLAPTWDLSRWEFRVSLDDGPTPHLWMIERDRENG